MSSEDDVRAARQSRDEAAERARRDAVTRASADTVIADLRAMRAQNHWADRVRELFRGN